MDVDLVLRPQPWQVNVRGAYRIATPPSVDSGLRDFAEKAFNILDVEDDPFAVEAFVPVASGLEEAVRTDGFGNLSF